MGSCGAVGTAGDERSGGTTLGLESGSNPMFDRHPMPKIRISPNRPAIRGMTRPTFPPHSRSAKEFSDHPDRGRCKWYAILWFWGTANRR